MVEVTEGVRFECDECGLLWVNEDDATTCCPHEAAKVTVYICGKCGEAHRYADEAKDCCPEED